MDSAFESTLLDTECILQHIYPTLESARKRDEVFAFIQSQINIIDPTAGIFTFGSRPLKVYLPGGDIDIGVVLPARKTMQFFDVLTARLQALALQTENGTLEAGVPSVNSVTFINAEVKLLKCVVNEVAVDITANTLPGLCAVAFFERMSHLIDRNNLFKRSVLLLKTWLANEAHLLASHQFLLSSYAVETMVLFTINFYHADFTHCYRAGSETLHAPLPDLSPLSVLFRFLQIFSQLDMDKYCITIAGPVSIASMTDVRTFDLQAALCFPEVPSLVSLPRRTIEANPSVQSLSWVCAPYPSEPCQPLLSLPELQEAVFACCTVLNPVVEHNTMPANTAQRPPVRTSPQRVSPSVLNLDQFPALAPPPSTKAEWKARTDALQRQQVRAQQQSQPPSHGQGQAGEATDHHDSSTRARAPGGMAASMGPVLGARTLPTSPQAHTSQSHTSIHQHGHGSAYNHAHGNHHSNTHNHGHRDKEHAPNNHKLPHHGRRPHHHHHNTHGGPLAAMPAPPSPPSPPPSPPTLPSRLSTASSFFAAMSNVPTSQPTLLPVAPHPLALPPAHTRTASPPRASPLFLTPAAAVAPVSTPSPPPPPTQSPSLVAARTIISHAHSHAHPIPFLSFPSVSSLLLPTTPAKILSGPRCFLIIDPLDATNNIGRSVSPANQARLFAALALGYRTLRSIVAHAHAVLSPSPHMPSAALPTTVDLTEPFTAALALHATDLSLAHNEANTATTTDPGAEAYNTSLTVDQQYTLAVKQRLLGFFYYSLRKFAPLSTVESAAQRLPQLQRGLLLSSIYHAQTTPILPDSLVTTPPYVSPMGTLPLHILASQYADFNASNGSGSSVVAPLARVAALIDAVGKDGYHAHADELLQMDIDVFSDVYSDAKKAEVTCDDRGKWWYVDECALHAQLILLKTLLNQNNRIKQDRTVKVEKIVPQKKKKNKNVKSKPVAVMGGIVHNAIPQSHRK